MDLPSEPDPSALGLESGIGSVPHKVDQGLLELIGVRGAGSLGARHHLHRNPRFQVGDHLHQTADPDWSKLRRRQACEPGVGSHEPSQRFGP